MIVFKSMPDFTHKLVPNARAFFTDLCDSRRQYEDMPTPLVPPESVVADNLCRILKYRGMEIADAARMLRVKPFQVRRLLSAEHAMTLRTLGQIATVFGFEPYQLLVPGLDPGNPQILRMLSPAEQRLYQALEEARRSAAP